MSENLKLYNKFRAVPQEAQKTIGGGRLKGMTDINPMWRIKVLTEEFGAAGIGWNFSKPEFQVIECSNGEKIVQCYTTLQVAYADSKGNKILSEPIAGVGGSMLSVIEKNGIYNDDEAFKKAYTDAQSVCCKALGVGADIYWGADSTKYTTPAAKTATPAKATQAIDKRRELPKDFDIDTMCNWLYKQQKAGKEPQAVLLANYKLTDEELNGVMTTYYQWRINNNL